MKLRSALLSLVCLAAAPAGAAAQEDGVFIDPDSPAKAEYEIPIDRARGDAAAKKKPGAGGEQPLFGEGVQGAERTPAGASSKRSGDGRKTTKRRNGGGRDDERDDSTALAGSSGGGPVEPLPAQPVAAETGGSLGFAGPALAVVAIAAAAGYMLRRRFLG